jgi:hypothetical protein
MLVEIPKHWRHTVAAILRRGSSGKEILLRKRARNEWQALTLDPFDGSLFHAIAAALEQETLHGKAHVMDEPGETYAFAFSYQAASGHVTVYAKVNLTIDGKVVIIYSAHRPDKEDELTQ